MQKFAALTTAAVTVVLLAGCASGGAGAGSTPTPKAQTKAEACKVLQKNMQSVAGELSSADIQGDPAGAVPKLKDFDGKLKAAADKVTNSDVHDAAAGFEASFSDLVAQLETSVKDSKSVDTTKLQETLTKVQSSTQQLSKVCG